MADSIIPLHVAIIPDGNRRWAKAQNKLAFEGHARGCERLRDLVFFAKDSGVKVITFWLFSTENWNRSETEINGLMKLFNQTMLEMEKIAHEHKIRVVHIGRRDRLGKNIISAIERVQEETKEYPDFCVCLAVDYGGQDELLRAQERLSDSGGSSLSIKNFLDTTLFSVSDPDLIIRTGGESRTSGFMPLQSTYSEWVFEKMMFPDFDKEAFKGALDEYGKRVRRFGK